VFPFHVCSRDYTLRIRGVNRINNEEVRMKQVEALNIEYAGFKTPETELEVEFEIAGLESVACEIQSRIARLRQALVLKRLLEGNNAQTE
jgi:hypothetical protein